MGKRTLGCLALLLCLLGLGGCVFGSVEEMYALPKSSEAYLNLQAKLNEEKGAGEYIAPLSGQNRQTIQLVDVDGDGSQEAVAFFRQGGVDTPLCIVILKQDQEGEYQVYSRIQGVGSEIESIEYADLGGIGSCDLLVSWQAGASLRTLVGYTIVDGQPVEIFRSDYGRYLTADLDGDGQQEVLLTRAGEEGSATRIEYYDSRDGMLTLTATTPLSEGTGDLSSWCSGLLEGGTPALFATSYIGRDELLTDVFILDGSHGLLNITLDPETRRSTCLLPYYAGVEPGDMNGDGYTEVPIARAVPAYGESSVSQFWWLDWTHYRADGSSQVAMTTYQSGDGWYLEIPQSWTQLAPHDLSMGLQESATIGVRSLTFARGEGDEAVPFLEICCLTGSDRTRQAKQNNRFTLYGDATTIYTAEFLEGGWDCGLSQEELTAAFHVGLSTWNTED